MENVQTECLADPAFARLVMNPKKKMVNCFPTSTAKARGYLEQEMKDNDEKPVGGAPAVMCRTNSATSGRGSISAMPMPRRDSEPEEKFVPKTYNGKTPKATKAKKDKPKKAAPKPAPKPADEEQLTFGDFGTEGRQDETGQTSLPPCSQCSAAHQPECGCAGHTERVKYLVTAAVKLLGGQVLTV